MNIRELKTYEECQAFTENFIGDLKYSDPMLSSREQFQNNLIKSIENPDRHRVIGVYQDNKLVGLFAFLTLHGEQYVEMLVGLSKSKDAYSEMLRYLENNFGGYDIDFVFNPCNDLLLELLKANGADFEIEQQKMVLGTPVLNTNTSGIEMFSERYAQQYYAIHNRDMYWTGEKVAVATDKFRTLLAIENSKVVGYLDVTFCFQENEPYDLFVLPEYRRRGYGRKLLSKALEMNQPNDMMLLVEVDNAAAIRLYESVGFVKAENQNCLTAHLKACD